MNNSPSAPRLLVFRPFSRATRRPAPWSGPRPVVRIVPRWRGGRQRSPLFGAAGHAALLGFLGLSLFAGPLEVVATNRGIPVQSIELTDRPRVPLDPFTLWWGLMGTPTLAFADPTAEARPEELALLGLSVDDLNGTAIAPRGKLSVPFRTQLDGSKFAGSNCGPASLGMVLDSYGISRTTEDLRYRSHTYQGTWGTYAGTGLDHLARVAEDLGVQTRGLYEGRRFRAWSIADLREEVRQGNPVVVLTKYRLLPGHEGSGTSFDHYVVLWDIDGDGFVYNDPAFSTARSGLARTIGADQLESAMRAAIIPRHAVAFLPSR